MVRYIDDLGIALDTDPDDYSVASAPSSDIVTQISTNWTDDTTALVVLDTIQNDFKTGPYDQPTRDAYESNLDTMLTDLSTAWKVLVYEQVYVPESYASWGADATAVDEWNAIVASVVASYPNAVVVSPNSNGWTPAVHSSSAHPTAAGVDLIVDTSIDAIG